MELFSTVDLVNQCLIDKDRVSAFAKALQKYVQPGDHVLDLGTGSGILSLLAAKFGAKKVTSVEIDPYLVKLSREIFKQNNFEKVISVIKEDARKVRSDPNEKFDVVVAEMITTGMIDEYQVLAINNLLKQGIITQDTIIIPRRLDTFLGLVETDYNAYGFKIPIVKHLWKQYDNNPKFNFLSNLELLNSYDFKEPTDENFYTTLNIKVSRDGVLNGIYLKSVAWFTEKIKLEDTTAFVAPVIIPIKSSEVSHGETIALKISYKFGGGYKTLKASYKHP